LQYNPEAYMKVFIILVLMLLCFSSGYPQYSGRSFKCDFMYQAAARKHDSKMKAPDVISTTTLMVQVFEAEELLINWKGKEAARQRQAELLNASLSKQIKKYKHDYLLCSLDQICDTMTFSKNRFRYVLAHDFPYITMTDLNERSPTLSQSSGIGGKYFIYDRLNRERFYYFGILFNPLTKKVKYFSRILKHLNYAELP
jgi:hypothetical protein